MNNDSECNCCPPSRCDACCMPQCSSTRPYESFRTERPPEELICSKKNCCVYGGHDTNPLPEYQCRERRTKGPDENKNSLGSPIGLVASNVNFQNKSQPTDTAQARYATNLVAFGRLHLNDAKTWDSLLVEDIMKEGLNLFATSQKKEASVVSPSDVYLPIEENILREFVLSKFTFHVELMPQFKLNTQISSDVRGATGDGVALTLEDIVPALKQFFRQHKYGLIAVGSFYVMIWRSSDVYFVFDACGRRVSDFQADKDKGVAMLMCFRSLENVRHLIVNLSGLHSADPLVIRELKLIKVITPSGGVIKQDYGTRTHQYEVVNDDYAYLKSELHLTLNMRDLLRNRSGLPVAVAAIVASKIEHPATWDRRLVEKILCFGVNFCQSRWFKCKTNETIDINEFPTHFTMGQFLIVIEFLAQKYEGTWRCVPGFKNSELSNAIKKAFDANYHKLIFQVNHQMYAIWKKHDFIYLLDPYRHRILGKKNESQVYDEMEKSATVRMFRSFDVFMNVFNHILLDSNRTSKFSIHIVKIKKIQQHKEKKGIVRTFEEPKLDANDEVLSINEHICFDEAEDLCQKALGEISDFEDDDLKSDVDEIELKTSSSEAEDLMEEEEAGLGEVEEIEGIESSSSGEEGSGNKKPAQSDKPVRKASKKSARKPKGGGKKGNTKSKKGQGTKDSEEVAEAEQNKKDENIDEIEKTEKMPKRKRKKREKNKKDKPIDKREDKEETVIEDTSKRENLKEEPKKKPETKKEKKKQIPEKVEVPKDKEVEVPKDKEVEVPKEKEVEVPKDRDKTTKDSDKIEDNKEKDKDLDKTKELRKNEEPSKVKEPNKDKDIREDVIKDKDEGKDKDTSKDKDQDQDQDKDKDLSKDKQKDSKKDRGWDKDFDALIRIRENNINKDLKLVQEENKLDQEKNEKEEENGNEIIEEDNEFENMEEENTSDKENEINNDTNQIEDKDVSKDTIQDMEIVVDDDNRDKEAAVIEHKLDNDGAEADDENEDNFKRKQHHCSAPNPNSYPGYIKCAVDMAVVGSESGTYESICKLFQAGFKVADRILTMTPWGNFVIFRCGGNTDKEEKYYFLFDGCTCNFDRFRHLDLSAGTAGLLCFKRLHNTIEYIRHLRKLRTHCRNENRKTADDICKEYCNRNFNLRL